MKTPNYENNPKEGIVQGIETNVEKVIDSIRSQNVSDIIGSLRDFHYFCMQTNEVAKEFMNELNLSSDDSAIWDNIASKKYFNEGLSLVSGLFQNHPFIEEDIAEIYERCVKIKTALSSTDSQSDGMKGQDDLMFEVVFEVYNHVFPNHLSNVIQELLT